MAQKHLDPSDPRTVELMAGCPSAWAGDHGFIEWCQALYDTGYNDGEASVTPPPPPPA